MMYSDHRNGFGLPMPTRGAREPKTGRPDLKLCYTCDAVIDARIKDDVDAMYARGDIPVCGVCARMILRAAEERD